MLKYLLNNANFLVNEGYYYLKEGGGVDDIIWPSRLQMTKIMLKTIKKKLKYFFTTFGYKIIKLCIGEKYLTFLIEVYSNIEIVP